MFHIPAEPGRSLKPGANVVGDPAARQWAAVKMRLPELEFSTDPVHVCRSDAPRNTGPTSGSGETGAAVAGVADGDDGGAAAGDRSQPTDTRISPAPSRPES